jgi:hypothetical protein
VPFGLAVGLTTLAALAMIKAREWRRRQDDR